MAETKNLGGLAYAIFAEIDRLQDPELTGDRLKEEITRKDQRRCRSCIDLEPSFKRSQASSGGGTDRKEQPND